MTKIAFALLLASVLAHADTTVCFTGVSGPPCVDRIVQDIDAAKTTVRVLAYSFSAKAVIRALAAAQKRGVDVQVVLDKSNARAKWSAIPTLLAAGVRTLIDYKHAIQHEKVVLIDGRVTYLGSYNFTANAEHHNAENSVRIDDVDLASKFGENFELHRGHAEAVRAKDEGE